MTHLRIEHRLPPVGSRSADGATRVHVATRNRRAVSSMPPRQGGARYTPFHNNNNNNSSRSSSRNNNGYGYNHRDNYDFDAECMDDPTRRLLIKKAWCHGQVVAPLQGAALCFWGATAENMPIYFRILLISLVVVLPAWTAVTWWAMKGRSLHHWRVIIVFGVLLEAAYIGVLVAASRNLAQIENLLALVFTGLQVMETAAYLAVCTMLRSAFINDSGDQAPLISF